ncbi:PREDICTED: cyclin-A1-4-like isoform X2 [Ipomoea nil]|uniref:cyclin-A1-4-like isoform X2 n=1 Tax=Ipomoea nil TaxID=35883 RepID=UPI000900C92C|nr:PREDICTED: cyclin-A1-4-like isoform X2 [Ipomoea nil]
MATTAQTRRSSSASNAAAKRQAAAAAENRHGKVAAAADQRLAHKRPALTNITNQRTGSLLSSRSTFSESSSIAPCTSKNVGIKKSSSSSTGNAGFLGTSIVPTSTLVKPITVPSKGPSAIGSDAILQKATLPPVTCSMDNSPAKSDGMTASMDESMSPCDSLRSPEVEYIDNNETAGVHSIEKKASSALYISEHQETTGNICKRDIIEDPQFCATMACDIYKHLRASEVKKRPSTDFMEKVQKDINASMRAILIDWLVEVAEEYRLVPDTLYLTVNYIDRYLSGNLMDRQRLQLLGVACMMIASKYEEICAPQVEEFCYITDNTYFKEEVLQMESAVLNYLKFEMTAPTAKCFLRRFVRATQGFNEASSLQLEHLASYLAELSLLAYDMLCYSPSLVAASAIFLARYTLTPSKKPWNSTLRHYTLYQPSDLRDCVMALHNLCCNSHHSSLPAIREKYSQHKYKFVAKKICPTSIPSEFFQDVSS